MFTSEHPMEKNELWQAALVQIETAVSRPNFVTWFHDTGITSMEQGVVTVRVPNGFAKEWLQNKYHKTILNALRALAGDVKEVSYTVGKPERASDADAPRETSIKRKRHPAPAFMDESMAMKDFLVNPETNLNPKYTFDAFVVGSFNELANAAAQQVIKNPGTSYNPLLIYGGVGLGKTHLIQAIGNELLKQNPQCKVKYVPSEKYMGEIVDALKNQQMNALKEKYRTVDLLIMDDIQFVARTEKMQEEFFHTFNALFEKNKQIVISSDRPPHAIATLEERLRSRFEGGMIADVGLPDLETRLLILKTKAEEKKLAVPEDVLRFLAEKIKTNVRELEGALNRIIVASKVSNAPLDVEIAKKIVVNHASAPKKFVSTKKIIKTVADFYDISESELMHHSRKRDIVKPRQIAMYLMREELKISFPSIGEKFGGRDHTTAIHSCGKIAQDLRMKPELEEELRAIKDKIFLDQ